MQQTIERVPETPEAMIATRARRRPLGLWMATALVVGNMVGSGVFLLPSSLAAIGPISLLSWVLTGAGSILLALVFARLGGRLPKVGGPYAYARAAFGDFAGFQTAWGYWIAVWAGNAAIATAFVGYLAVFWPRAGSDRVVSVVVALSAIWLLTAVNALGAREGGAVQLVTTVLKFVPLALVGLIGLAYLNLDNLTPFAPGAPDVGSRLDAITTAGTLTLWAFIGLESATIPAEEVDRPERTLPRATIIGTAVTTLVYIVATVAVMGVIPASSLAESTSPFADAAGVMFGGNWAKVVAGVALISTFGALNGWILLQGRVPLAAARDGLFPAAFGRVSGRRETPIFGLVASSVLVSILMITNYNDSLVDIFTQVLLLATLTTIVPYAYSAAAQLQLLVTDRARFDGRHAARDATIAALAFGYSIWMMYGAGEETIAKGFLLLMAGIPVYVWLTYTRRRAGAQPLEATR